MYEYSNIFSIFLLCVTVCNCIRLEYTTSDRRPCITACMSDTRFFRGQYQYCFTKRDDTTWNYCYRQYGPDEMIYFTNKPDVVCSSHCGYFGEASEWCYTDKVGEQGAYSPCSSQYGYSATGEKCIDECSLGESTYKCIVRRPDACALVPCSPPPINLTAMNDVAKLVNENTGPCPSCSNARRKRLSENVIRTFGVVDLAARMGRRHGERQVQNYTSINSVTSYVTLHVPPERGLPSIDLPLVVRATITQQHLTPRTSIPNFVATQMYNMEGYSGDDRGHLVAASLGGPNLPFNFVPQAPSTNRALHSSSYWLQFENQFRRSVSNGGRVELVILVAYCLNTSRRPVAFGVSALRYAANGALECDTGTCYFTNDPEGGSPC